MINILKEVWNLKDFFKNLNELKLICKQITLNTQKIIDCYEKREDRL
jgi:hypothetical protein